MLDIIIKNNEQEAGFAFSKQSAIFDEFYSGNAIIKYKRERVRQHVLQYLQPNSNILELNAGTGEDAVFFAQQGHFVHATDLSEGMQKQLNDKVIFYGVNRNVSQEICSFTKLKSLNNKGPYDCIFSNFAGLNCTGQLDKVLESFDDLVTPGGRVTLVVLPKFCLWELLLIFKGKFRTATRRFFCSKGQKAKIDNAKFTCWYYSPSYISKHLQEAFDVIKVEGLCTIVPPSYIENFAEKYLRTFLKLCKLENRLKAKFPFKYIGDYFIITLKKRL